MRGAFGVQNPPFRDFRLPLVGVPPPTLASFDWETPQDFLRVMSLPSDVYYTDKK